MRLVSATFATFAVAACASAAPDAVPYDEVAHVVGADLRAVRGGGELAALHDVLRIARGGRPDGFAGTEEELVFARHGGVTYQYAVTCHDAVAKRLPCGEWTVAADAIVLWGGGLEGEHLAGTVFHHGAWTLRDVRRDAAWFTGKSVSLYDVTLGDGPRTLVELRGQATLLVDPGVVAVVGGTLAAEIVATTAADELALDAIVTFAPPGPARIELAGTDAYWLDTSTGVVSAAVILE